MKSTFLNWLLALLLLSFLLLTNGLSAQTRRYRVRQSAPVRSSEVAPTATEFLAQVNDLRKNGCRCGGQQMPPVAPLRWNEKLASAAQAHADDMRAKNYFNHKSADGRTFDKRISAQGYQWQSCGENIAMGQINLQEVMNSWQSSVGHCRQMMDKSVSEMGAARSKTGDYWVQDFAAPMQ
jgi:uncharacterized protein YkwD